MRYLIHLIKQVVVKHPNNKPATGVSMVISASGTLNDGNVIKLRRKDDGNNVAGKDKTDDLGQASFTVDVSPDVKFLSIKVKDPDFTRYIGV